LVRELVRSATVERKQRTGRVAFTDGREFEFAAVPLPDGNALFTMLDVTASRTVEAALRERTEALEEADRLKTAFVSNMSYELRTPLTSIGGFAEMLAGGYAGELAPTATDYVDRDPRLGRQARRSDRRRPRPHPERQRQPPARRGQGRPRRCAPRRPRRSASRRRRRTSISRSRSRPARARSPATAPVFASRSTMCSRTPSPTPTRAAGSSSTPTGDRKGAAITVSDNGRGIAPADQARVFDRFSRTDEPRGADEAALGLGLPLAKQFVEAHGGSIELVSEAGGPAPQSPCACRGSADAPGRPGGDRGVRPAAGAGAARWGHRRFVRRARERARPRWRAASSPASAMSGEVASPTFPIVIPYETLDLPVWHVDLYRIEDPRELDELALDEALRDGALIVEWPERMGEALWPHSLRLTLKREGRARAP
jgi:signal transduction histidine kinase